MPNTALILRSRAGTSARSLLGGLGPRLPLLALAGLLTACAWMAVQEGGLRQASLLLAGAGLGFTLYRSGFGFAGAWRAVLVDRRCGGLRAQLALLTILTLAFFPLFAIGEAFGRPLFDVVRPVGVALLAGAFLFGIGAQLASACSSGSLAGLGNGKLRYLVVVAFMIAGATLGSAHMGWWEAQPNWISFSMLREWGPVAGMAGNLSLLGLLALATVWFERTRHGRLYRTPSRQHHWLRGPWPMSWGVAALALLCIATLLLAGRPWIIVSALPLWGAKLIGAAGIPWDVAFWDYWGAESRIDALDASLWSDGTTLMIWGLVLGTALAAVLAGSLRLIWRITPGEALSAAAGGILLGYGGVVGLGCNIGAFLAGVSSGSLHGWVWLAAAFAGTATGVGIRAIGTKLGSSRA
ncbi:MAG: YeeE/YedE thiosulfate transporter family protein [Gammaproteobacteria bacterium]